MFRLEKVRYKDFLKIDYLEINSNKITAILGESGSGKTTLLRLLNNMIKPCEGIVYFNDNDINGIDPIKLRRKVVMLSQTPVIFKGTIKDNLLIGLKFSKEELALDNDLNKILKMINLDNKNLDDEVDSLSGGEKQRLALGRVMLMNPDVYLLDEPSSALDDNTEDFILEKLIEYTNEKDTTIVIVTHSKNIAFKYSDYVIKLKKGRIINE